ncbi:MAG: hypothetical protein GTO62_15700 [Planctomycetales bacterium]|nr:hypothetical protein [Planctomycetales bacterium]NIP70667.1 hypothetical protein [Planctomycetales bacterium]
MAYCSSCKLSLDTQYITGENAAWCPACRDHVELSVFQVPGWTVGVLLLLTTYWQYWL